MMETQITVMYTFIKLHKNKRQMCTSITNIHTHTFIHIAHFSCSYSLFDYDRKIEGSRIDWWVDKNVHILEKKRNE